MTEEANNIVANLEGLADRRSIAVSYTHLSEEFSKDERNMENIRTSDSPYRFARLKELIDVYKRQDEKQQQIREQLETAAAEYRFRPGSFDPFYQWPVSYTHRIRIL